MNIRLNDLKIKTSLSLGEFKLANITVNGGGYDRGYEEGYVKGYEVGFDEGETKGNADGYKHGYSDGFDEGENNGYTKGYAVGYTEGYEVGKTEGGGNDEQLIGLLDGTITELTIPQGAKVVSNGNVLHDLTKLEILSIPDSLTSIQSSSSNCHKLSVINVPNLETWLNISFSYGLLKSSCGLYINGELLTDLVVPTTITKINSRSFTSYTYLTSITMHDAVSSIGYNAFYGCVNLKKVVFGKNLKTIDTYAFYDCTSCIEYDFSRCTSIPSLAGSTCFRNINADAKIIVPPHLYDDWIMSTNWTTLVNHIVKADGKAIPNEENFNIYVDANTLKEIADYSFFGKKAVIGISRSEVLYDGDVPFIRMYGDGSSPEAYAQVQNIEGKTTGKFLVFAYRLPTSNTESHNHFQVYANTTGGSPTGQGDFFELSTTKDGKWHIVAIDIEQAILNYADVITGKYASKFIANTDGTYDIGRLRIDFFNQKTSTESYIDVAYVGICDTIEKAVSADADYDGAEWNAKDLSSVMSGSLLVDDYGVEYLHIEANTGNTTEKFIELRNAQRIIPNVNCYVGILFKNAPDGFAEVYSSSNTAEWLSSSKYSYTYKDKHWRYGVIKLNSKYVDSVCRRFRFDFFNGVSKNTTYSIDIGFIKSFISEEEANDYYTRYKLLNNIPDAPFYVPF